MPQDLDFLAGILMSQLDIYRARWFELAKELVSEALGDPVPEEQRSIVNRQLEERIDLGMSEEMTPRGYGFNCVNGETVEAALIGLQTKVAWHFARDKGYVDQESQADLAAGIAARSKGRWLISMATHLSNESQAVEAAATAAVLAHFLLGEREDSRQVRIARDALGRAMAGLGYFSQLGTAVAFLDEVTAEELMRELRGPEGQAV